MEIEDFQSFCLQLKGVSEDIKWEHNLCFCVKGKIFCMVNLDENPLTFCVKLSPHHFEELTQLDGIVPAPYLGRSQWVRIDHSAYLSIEAIQGLLLSSYDLIKSKLPKKVQIELNA